MQVTLVLTKTTKRTYRYDASDENELLRTLYVQQTAFPGGAPKFISVTIEGLDSLR